MAILIENSSGSDIEEYVPSLEEANNPAFWQALNPHMSITPQGSKDKIAPFPIQVTGDMMECLRSEGYIQLDNMIAMSVIGALRRTVMNLKERGIDPCFTFVYDEFWGISRQLASLLVPVLGEGYQQLPDFWTWHLDPKKQQAGWEPHRDRIHVNPLFSNGMPKSVTVWLALTNATPLNGCIYLLPAYLDEDYLNFDVRETNVNAHSIRALPARAGTLLMWNQRVVHWGGTSSSRADEPRISMAIEFQRADVPPFNNPMIKSPEALLPFDIRMMLIAKQIVQYHHMYRVSPAMAALAEQVLS